MEFLQQRFAGLPVWAWGLIVVGGLIVGYFFLRSRNQSQQQAGTSGTLGTNPAGQAAPIPAEIDPYTGVPYSVEEAIDPNTGLPAYYSYPGGYPPIPAPQTAANQTPPPAAPLPQGSSTSTAGNPVSVQSSSGMTGPGNSVSLSGVPGAGPFPQPGRGTTAVPGAGPFPQRPGQTPPPASPVRQPGSGVTAVPPAGPYPQDGTSQPSPWWPYPSQGSLRVQ